MSAQSDECMVVLARAGVGKPFGGVRFFGSLDAAVLDELIRQIATWEWAEPPVAALFLTGNQLSDTLDTTPILESLSRLGRILPGSELYVGVDARQIRRPARPRTSAACDAWVETLNSCHVAGAVEAELQYPVDMADLARLLHEARILIQERREHFERLQPILPKVNASPTMQRAGADAWLRSHLVDDQPLPQLVLADARDREFVKLTLRARPGMKQQTMVALGPGRCRYIRHMLDSLGFDYVGYQGWLDIRLTLDRLNRSLDPWEQEILFTCHDEEVPRWSEILASDVITPPGVGQPRFHLCQLSRAQRAVGWAPVWVHMGAPPSPDSALVNARTPPQVAVILSPLGVDEALKLRQRLRAPLLLSCKERLQTKEALLLGFRIGSWWLAEGVLPGTASKRLEALLGRHPLLARW